MKVVKDKIGNADILIQTLETELDIVNAEPDGPQLVDTGLEEDIKDAYGAAKTVIKEIAADIGADLNTLPAEARPKDVEMEFHLGFSAGANIWVLSGQGEYAFKVKMTWQL